MTSGNSFPHVACSRCRRLENRPGLAPAHFLGFERLSDTEMVPAHSDDLPPGLLQDNVDTTVRLLPGVPPNRFSKKVIYQDTGHAHARRTPLSWRPSPAPTLTPSRLRNVLISCFQVRPVFLLFQKVESTPGFWLKPLHLLPGLTFSPTSAYVDINLARSTHF